MFRRTIYITWALLLIRARCSRVRDCAEKHDTYLKKYCPAIGNCPEGAHVLCLYHNPQRITGVRCFEPMNVTMSRSIATQLLDVSNAVRSKIALGKETGKKGTPLPKAYGMNKLRWSNELATFAQVMANQCILRHDLCRSTEKFPQPGQTAGLVRFTYPDWKPVSKKVELPPGLIPEKLTYATTQVLNSWYQNKKYVIPEWIKSCPDWMNEDISTVGKVYLEMIYYKATHMGCGIIGYTEYAYHDNNANVIYNSVQIICNFSARPSPGQAIYDINKPNSPGNTVRCGCPKGFTEDASCLCVPSESREYCDSKDKKCKTSLVLMPIFTVEDAPPEKDAARYGPDDTRLMVGDENGPREIRYDMLRPILNDTDGPHYELVPQNGLNQSVALVTTVKEDDLLGPLHGTPTKAKGELPRIELFHNPRNKETKAMHKYTAMKNEEAQFDLARTVLIKSYDELMQRIKPKRQGQNILQIYNEELLKQIAKDETLNEKKIKKQANKNIRMSYKDLMIVTERSTPRINSLEGRRDISIKRTSSPHHNMYSLPRIDVPTNIQLDHRFSEYYILAQAEEILPAIRNHLMQIQKNAPVRKSGSELTQIRPTISENVRSLPRIDVIETQTVIPITLNNDLKDTHEKQTAIHNKLKVTENKIPLEDNLLLIPRDTLLDIIKHSERSISKDDVLQQFQNRNLVILRQYIPSITINDVLVPHNAMKEDSDLRAQYEHYYAFGPLKSLKETNLHRNALTITTRDSNSVRKEFEIPEIALADVIHVKDSGEYLITNDKSLQDNELLKNQIHIIDNKTANKEIIRKSPLHTERREEPPHFNDDSKLCRLEGGKLICDVPIMPSILKEPVSNKLLSKYQVNENKGRKSTTRLKLITKQRPSTPRLRLVKVKKVKTSVKEEIPPDKNNFVVVKSNKNIIRRNFNKNRNVKAENNPVRWIADDVNLE